PYVSPLRLPNDHAHTIGGRIRANTRFAPTVTPERHMKNERRLQWTLWLTSCPFKHDRAYSGYGYGSRKLPFASTDRLIDQIMYKPYGLIDEETTAVEADTTTKSTEDD
ncbi:MAG: hypothetical protein JW753_11505, partial [Dehalococcoidia bacterium]|nr:hypothetical protein [Dehalococcoidia bacterium]